MRVLFVHERFGSLAGAETNVIITGTELKKRGHVMGILHGPSTGKGETAWKATFENQWSFAVDDPVKAAQQCLQQFQPDVVYVHKMADLPMLETLVQSQLPLVRMVHDHDIYCMRSYKYNYFSRKICERAFSPHCVFPCGAFLVRDANGSLPVRWVSYSDKKREIALNQQFHRMFVVTDFMRQELVKNGFDPARIQLHPPVPRSVPPIEKTFSNRNLILYVGQITRGKGVDILLESLVRLRTPFECIILGDGNYRAHCEALSRRLGLSDRVHFKGFVPQEELMNFYRECSVVAISSVWPEPIATVGLEVMRFGLPIVAFDAGGIREWLKDGYNGFLIPWMDRDRYAAALDRLLKDKALARQMGERGLQLVQERYDFEQYISGLEKAFHQLIEERHRRAMPLQAVPA